MPNLGETLRQAREKSGLTVREVSEQTKIRIQYIEHLEAGRWEALPPKVFVVGFLRNLGRLYRVDSDGLVRDYDQELAGPGPTGKQETRLAEEQEAGPTDDKRAEPVVRMQKPPKPKTHKSVSSRKGRNSTGRLIAVVIGIVAVAFLLVFWMSRGEPEAPPPDPLAEITDPAPEPEPPVWEPEPEEPEPDPFDGFSFVYTGPGDREGALEIVVRVDPQPGNRCWVGASADGEDVFRETLGAGEAIRVIAREDVTVTLGNAGVVTIYENGEDIGLEAAPGEVLRKVFSR